MEVRQIASRIGCSLFVLAIGFALSGCRLEVGGHGSVSQPWDDSVEFYPPGPEFEREREANLKKLDADAESDTLKQ